MEALEFLINEATNNNSVCGGSGVCFVALDAGDVYAAYGEGGITNAGNELTGINAAGSVYDIIFDTAVGKAEATIPVREDVPYE